MGADDFLHSQSGGQQPPIPPFDLFGFPSQNNPSIPVHPLEQSLLCALLNCYWVRDVDFIKATTSSVFNFYIHELRHKYHFPIQSSLDFHEGKYPSGDPRYRQQWWFFINPSQIKVFENLYPQWRYAFDERAFPNRNRNAKKGYMGKKPNKQMWQNYYQNLQQKLGDQDE